MFRYLDSNCNGKISLEEFRKKKNYLYLPDKFPENIEDKFKVFQPNVKDEINIDVFITKYI